MKRLNFLFALLLLLGVGTTAWAQTSVKAIIQSVSTNMGTYQTYAIENVKDGSYSSKFWSNGNQAADQYVLADLGAVRDLHEVKLYFCSGDQPYGGTVSISDDNATWEELGTFSNVDFASDNSITVAATGKSARYVRFLNTNPNTGVWFQMAEFEVYVLKAPNAYDQFGFGKPGITDGGNKRAQFIGDILGTTGVWEGSTLVFFPTGDRNYQDWSNDGDWVHVDAGATFNLRVAYGDEGWNDLSVFMMRSNGTNSLIYGPYEGSWGSGLDGTLSLFYNIHEAEDMATVNEVADGVVTFPITMPNDLAAGEAVIIRFLIHGSDVGTDPNAQNIVEGNYCDYIFYCAEKKYSVKMNGVNTLGDGNTAVATFSADKNFRLPAGVKAYYATAEGVNEDYVKLTEFTGKVLPANEGFLLTYNAAGDIELQSTIQTAEAIEGNLLKPSTGAALDATVNAYVLNAQDGNSMFCKLATDNRVIAKNKAYLELNNPSPVIKMSFNGEATGIESVETATPTAPIYDLSGRRVMHAAKGGIYIQNGKKFIVR